MTPKEHLERLGACFSGRLWVGAEKTHDPQLLWSRCPRAEWMVWYLAKHVSVSHRLGGPEHRRAMLVAAILVHLAMTVPPKGVDNSAWEARSQLLVSLVRWAELPQEQPWSYTASIADSPRVTERDILLDSAQKLLLDALVKPWEAAAATEHAMFSMTVGLPREERKTQQRNLADIVRFLVPLCPVIDLQPAPGAP